MATKAELAAERDQYYAHLAYARAYVGQGSIVRALEAAVASFEFVDGMMQFERKYEEKQFDRIDAIDIVLRFAPVMFHEASLASLAELLKDQKRIDRNADADLADELSKALVRMWSAYALWDRLERGHEVSIRDIGRACGNVRDAQAILDEWEFLELVRITRRTDDAFVSLTTNLFQRAPALCGACGAKIQGTKYKLLDAGECPGCRRTTSFVLLRSD